MDFSLSEDDAQLVELVDRVAMEKFGSYSVFC
jgi:hypothetical protein